MIVKLLPVILVGIAAVAAICIFVFLILSSGNNDRSIDDRAQEDFLAEWRRKKQ